MNESICCRIYGSSDTCAEILDVLLRLHDNSASAIHTIADSDWLLGRGVSALMFKAHRSRTLRWIWVNQGYFQQRVRFLHFHCVLWEWKNSWNSRKGQQENSSCSSFSSHFLPAVLTHTHSIEMETLRLLHAGNERHSYHCMCSFTTSNTTETGDLQGSFTVQETD